MATKQELLQTITDSRKVILDKRLEQLQRSIKLVNQKALAHEELAEDYIQVERARIELAKAQLAQMG